MDEADLRPWKLQAGSKAVVHEWEIDGDTRQRMFASNGLIYEVFRLRHEHVPERLARGKRYDVSRLATADKKEKVNYLKRHAIVCGRFRGHPQIPINLAAAGRGGRRLLVGDRRVDSGSDSRRNPRGGTRGSW